jgi:voltage-gated potassium channel
MVIGTFGYMLIEDMPFFDSFYMTMISITTTGYREIGNLSDAGRGFTVFIISAGVVSLAYIAGRILQFIILFYMTQRRKMKKDIENLSHHFIIAGFGRMGRIIHGGLSRGGIDTVIIEQEQEIADELADRNILHIQGDATKDEVLENAGIDRARGLVTVLPTDAENVFTVLTARGIRPDCFIVSRALEPETENKLKRAGADRVVKPVEIAGNRLVHLLLRPGVMDFIDLVVRGTSMDLQIEELEIKPDSPMVDRKISEFINREDLNMLVIGIYRENGDFVYNPTADDIIMANDRLIALGKEHDFTELKRLCRSDTAGS